VTVGFRTPSSWSWILLALVPLVVVVAAHGTASAQPWAAGVAPKTQTRANDLFAEGNALFAREAHAPALAKYTEAIALWDHPVIRFNMAVTLVRLDRFLEAAEAIDRSLRFGREPFPTTEQHRQALDYQKLIARQVGTVEATCSQAKVDVALDGQRWFTCPGTQQRRVLAGKHLVVAEASGHFTRSLRVDVTGGAVSNVRVELQRIDTVGQLEYPTRRWIPWSVAGGGAAIGLGGLLVWLAGRDQLTQYRENFLQACPQGCDLDGEPALRDQRDSALFKGKVGASLMFVGVAALAGGTVWNLWFNTPRRVMPTVEAGGERVTVGASGRF
jgi:hypothetical protein